MYGRKELACREFKAFFQDIESWILSSSDLPATKLFPLPGRITLQDIRSYINATKKHRLLQFKEESGNRVEVCVSQEARDLAFGKKDAAMGGASSYLPFGDAKRQRVMPQPRGSPKSRSSTPRSRAVEPVNQDPHPPSPPPLPPLVPAALPPAPEFEGVRIYVVVSDEGLTVEQRATVESTVVALGGHVAADAASATHAVFPDSGQMMKADWEELVPTAAIVWNNGGNLVSFKWFLAVTERGLCAQDSKECTKFMPDFFQQEIAVGNGLKLRNTRVSRSKAPSSAPELAKSLQQTKAFLERPPTEEEFERDMRRAMEESLKDMHGVPGAVETPEEVLGVRPGASPAEVKAAYRSKVMANHPDKGGDSQSFVRVRTAYLALSSDPNLQAPPGAIPELCDEGNHQRSDFELRDHRALVRELFEKDGVDLESCIRRQAEAMKALGLEICDLGAINRNERGEDIYNQCFYLSLARTYLGCDSDVLKETALTFKRNIEAAVLAAHPEWGGSRVGEDVQAFSDFLFYVLGSHALLSELSVAVFDATSGGVELYIGRHYPGPERQEERRSNLLTLRYRPGHYEALVPTASAQRPMLTELQRCLEKQGVPFVPTEV